MLQATFVLLGSTERIASGALPPASIFDVLGRLLRVCVDFVFSASAKRAVTTGIPSMRIIAVSPPCSYTRKNWVKAAHQLDRFESRVMIANVNRDTGNLAVHEEFREEGAQLSAKGERVPQYQ